MNLIYVVALLRWILTTSLGNVSKQTEQFRHQLKICIETRMQTTNFGEYVVALTRWFGWTGLDWTALAGLPGL